MTEDLELEQLDVKTAFLHGVLEEDIYMSQPVSFSAMGEKSHPCMSTKEKPLWLQTSAEDVVPEVGLLHPAAWLPPVSCGFSHTIWKLEK